ncbi:MAG: tRNA (N6-threonylcarbamoyladenosine(37)-N6)-methyltransferase TrmO [Candidatus Korarchaeum sp.]|nr:tRNA (N6-threonylcarbamoyladenosine(37)-N6)-methyltransferase TrmO [Candidatus Korarchaeum sp.]MDW8036100.1 tRNA (N6-threonylcarbamoyladenosine(37)-N6)-methyltransferase TrmO [Candidatus Korarchaeum sp.]
MICFKPVGVVRTSASRDEVKESFEGVEGCIEVLEEYENALKGLEGFSHIIALTYLHEVTEEQRSTLLVRPRRLLKLGLKLDEIPELGVFATDSPHRPNPIGLHILRVKSIEGRRINVSNLDAFDGTPVLDIKPYTSSRIVEHPSFPDWYSELLGKVRALGGREV